MKPPRPKCKHRRRVGTVLVCECNLPKGHPGKHRCYSKHQLCDLKPSRAWE